ncbi:hypothetical protein [Flavitalea sp.]|nr:hypothetical protein [Flavitalea sp.]
MLDRHKIARNRNKSYADILILVILIAPFIIISVFNHPLGDDYWITSMVRKDGFIQAQKMLYDTVSARFMLLTITSLSPLTFGNFWLYKLIPILFIIVFILVFAFLLHTIFGEKSNKRDNYFLSACFTTVYLNVMPGPGEGIYWFSSLVAYQVATIIFVLWIANIFRLYNRNTGAGPAAAYILLFIVLHGFNEPLALITSILNGLILMFRFPKKKGFTIPLICLVLSLPLWYYLLAAPSFNYRYVSTVKPGSGQFIKSFWFSIRLAIYHVGKSLINPVFWVCTILAARSVLSLWPKQFQAPAIRLPSAGQVIFYCLTSMFLIGFVSSYYSPSHVVSLRLTNMIIFVFLSGLLYLALFYMPKNQQFPLFKKLNLYYKYKYPAVFCLILASLLFENNFTRTSKDLMSGAASGYDMEMKNRYQLLKTCIGDTCTVPSLQNRPASIRYSGFDNDIHIGEYFNKTILYTGNQDFNPPLQINKTPL